MIGREKWEIRTDRNIISRKMIQKNDHRRGQVKKEQKPSKDGEKWRKKKRHCFQRQFKSSLRNYSMLLKELKKT